MVDVSTATSAHGVDLAWSATRSERYAICRSEADTFIRYTADTFRHRTLDCLR
jgi:hypothetical protein